MLLQHLQNNFGISGKSLQWIRSYLESRVNQVQIDGVSSDMHSLDSEFLRAQSWAHWVLFYTHLLLVILYVSMDLASMSMPMTHKCTSLIQEYQKQREEEYQFQKWNYVLMYWMTVNKLKLKHNKTEFFIAGTTQGLKKLPLVKLKVGNDMIIPSTSVRNLGIWDQDTKHNIVRYLILSGLDYLNALLYGAKSKDLDRLQSFQNKAVKIVFSVGKRDSPSLLTNTLHGLPIRERIIFKICMYFFFFFFLDVE